MSTAEEKIIEAAREVLIENGLADIRMQDISDRAGISRTTLNYYFRSREKLVEKVAGEILRKGMPNMIRVLNNETPLFEKIEKFVSEYIETISKNPFVSMFLIDQCARKDNDFIAEIMQDTNPNIDGFRLQVAHEIEAGNIVKVNPVQLYMHIISLCAFPVMAKNLFAQTTNTSHMEMDRLLEERKLTISILIINSIKKTPRSFNS